MRGLERGLEIVKTGFAEVAGVLRDENTMRDVAFTSHRMAPVLALVVVGTIGEDVRAGKQLSRESKLSVAGFAANLAVGTVALARS